MMLGWVKGEILAAAPPNSHLIAEVIFHSSICSYEVRKKTYKTNKIQINLHTQKFIFYQTCTLNFSQVGHPYGFLL